MENLPAEEYTVQFTQHGHTVSVPESEQWLTEACLSFILSFETTSSGWRTVNTTLAPSTFLIRITSETHQHQTLQHHQI